MEGVEEKRKKIYLVFYAAATDELIKAFNFSPDATLYQDRFVFYAFQTLRIRTRRKNHKVTETYRVMYTRKISKANPYVPSADAQNRVDVQWLERRSMISYPEGMKVSLIYDTFYFTSPVIRISICFGPAEKWHKQPQAWKKLVQELFPAQHFVRVANIFPSLTEAQNKRVFL